MRGLTLAPPSNLFLIVESQTIGLIAATVVGSSFGAAAAYSFKRMDRFHLVDLLADELGEDENELRDMIKYLRAQYKDTTKYKDTPEAPLRRPSTFTF